MTMYRRTRALLDEARRERRCAFGADAAAKQTLQRRCRAGELVRPFAGLYAPRDYWEALSPCERTSHVMRALCMLRPRWVFAGVCALEAYGLAHSWRLHDGAVWIADASHNGGMRAGRSPLRRIGMACVEARVVDGLPVTTMARTVADCVARFPFRQALPIVDSALAHGLDVALLERVCRAARLWKPDVESALRYADARSESGGESMARATILALGFAPPELQVDIRDPRAPSRRHRPDFLWRLHDGRVVVLEFDGMRKYADPVMTGRRSTKQIVVEQLARDDALRAAGVTTVLHCHYEDAARVGPLERMLLDAGVPWTGVPAGLEGALERIDLV